MFIHNLKYSLKIIFKNKGLIFWTFIFPIILGTFFYMAFSNIENSEKLNIINIAVDENIDLNFKSIIENIEHDNNKLFNITYTDSKNAKDMLEANEIIGYLDINKNIMINKNGIDETVFKYVVETIKSNTKIYTDIMSSSSSIDINTLMNNDIKIKDITNKNISYTMIEYYTLIAMTCLYGGAISMYMSNISMPNLSSVGKRIGVSSIKKKTMLLSSLLASFIVQLIGLALLFLYTIFVLKVDYGDKFIYILILSLLGSLSGLSFGVFISTMFKTNDNAKTGILIAGTMFMCFLSGMMGITMKYVIDKNIPILNKINPAAMITDGLYSLYYYDTLNRFKIDAISLGVFSLILIAVSYYNLRRQKYDSI